MSDKEKSLGVCLEVWVESHRKLEKEKEELEKKVEELSAERDFWRSKYHKLFDNKVSYKQKLALIKEGDE